ncbi:hypothetical protein ACQI4L_27875 [Mycolicibacterium litorale]|uniref:hypothetical protein n=1 Tax=Mycolicibacterium litorale TaxID=758802 RepID=UPI003CE9EE8B
MARAMAVTPVVAATTNLDLSNDPTIKGKAGAVAWYRDVMGLSSVGMGLVTKATNDRTKAALDAKRGRGDRLGRPRLAKPSVVRRILLDRNTGLSFTKIAAALEAGGILSPAGRPTWQPSTVRRIYAEWARVIAPPPGDTNRGRVGIVDQTYADAGDMIHVVRFGDGTTTDHYVAELKSIRSGT